MRTYTIINLVGLVISLTGAIVIARYVHQELTVDDYIEDVDRVYVVGATQDGAFWSLDGKYLEPQLKALKPECATRSFLVNGTINVNVDNVMNEVSLVIGDDDFVNVLPRKVLSGKMQLENPDAAVVTKTYAQKVWGNENVIGKELEVCGWKKFHVVAVVDVPDTKSLFNFDVLVSRENFTGSNQTCGLSIWRMPKGFSMSDIGGRIDSVEIKEEYYGAKCKFAMKPIKDIYFDPLFFRVTTGDFIPEGNLQSVKMLTCAGILLLSIGIFNFVNIYSIVLRHRRRDFAIKRLVGASYMNVFVQLLLENIILTLITVILAWGMVVLTTEWLDKYCGLGTIPNLSFDVTITIVMAVVFPLIVSAVALFCIVHDDRKSVKETMDRSRILSRQIPLALQNVVTFFLLVVCGFTMSQLYYMLHSDLGYHDKDIFTFDLFPVYTRIDEIDTDEEREANHKLWNELNAKSEDAMRRINSSPYFVGCAMWGFQKSPLLVNFSNDITSDVYYSYPKSDIKNAGFAMFSPDCNKIFEFKFLEGGFSPTEELYNKGALSPVIITESTKKMFGIKDIKDEVMQLEGGFDVPICGVVNDFHSHHLAVKDVPTVIIQWYDLSNIGGFGFRMIARCHPDRRKEALDFLQSLYEEYNGKGNVLEFVHIEDELERLYADDKRVAHLYTTFAILSILVSCMGLFGISLYDIQHRRREIAIRKVNGAKMKDIFILMSKRYVYTLAVAIAIGTPLALYALHLYIEGYAHHVPLTPWYFLLSALLMLVLTLLTIYWQVRRAVKENPADVMKSE